TCRLQRYVVQELAATFLPAPDPDALPCAQCGYDLRANTTGACPECGAPYKAGTVGAASDINKSPVNSIAAGAGPTVPALWPLQILRNKHGASIFAVAIGALIAAMPTPGNA